jgi:hypothetical protein
MNRLTGAIGAMAAVAAIVSAAGAANASVVINVTESGGNVDVTAKGSLDLTGATFDHQQPYSTGIIPGGSNFYIALGSTPGMDWYRFTSVNLPFGTSTNFFTSGLTSGDAFSIWGFSGGAPLVGVATGYTSGTLVSASMVLAGQSIAGMTLIPGTYVFGLPGDTVMLNIAGGSVPEPATWAVMLLGFGLAGAALRRREPGLAPCA